MTPADLLAVPGVPESTFAPATSPDLPAVAPPAPWNCTSTGIVWLARGGPRALAVAGREVARGAKAPVVIGGLISYASTPVGTYHEVFGGVALRTGRDVAVTIPFMAVDSRDSVVGGRQNWSLPKVLARFTGEPTELAMTAEGDGWTVRVTARPIAPKLPVKTTGRVVQAWPDGSVRSAVLTGKARSRPALVTVEVRSNGNLASWLRPGRHLGAVMTGTEFTLPDPS
ncbi:MAG: acetoacetate decarboxylase family protein [Jatrophihabitans sp.]|uniref:acetoacetate decarboxylase family protein n=1 Tax=Jatrophihabitans sp. TaxID=1932789 RepID=UPI0039167EE3